VHCNCGGARLKQRGKLSLRTGKRLFEGLSKPLDAGDAHDKVSVGAEKRQTIGKTIGRSLA